MITLRTWVKEDPFNGNAYYACMHLSNGITIDLYQSEIPSEIEFPEYGRIQLTPKQAELISPGCTTLKRVAVTATHPEEKA